MTHTLAIVGCTGAVGREALAILEALPADDALTEVQLKLLASARSVGGKLSCRGIDYEIEELTKASFTGVDLAIFSAGGDRSRTFAPFAANAGCVVIDNSSAFRMEPQTPLVVPEINADLIKTRSPGQGGIIANPNCSTILAAVVLFPLAAAFGIERAVLSTYQAVSGAGAAAMQELLTQTRAALDATPTAPGIFAEPCAFNLFSHDSAVDPETGRNVEEEKMLREIDKIFTSADRPVQPPRLSCTCIRVPVLRAHSESINLTLRQPAEEDALREVLAGAPGVQLRDDRQANDFPTPRKAECRDEVLVGRLLPDPSQPQGLGYDLFLSGDQLRKGAALNALQIARALLC
ncbi:MAG: aspartate-semialdehyde dehydrogenase [Phycisphaerales bacterium JB038]